LYGKKKIYKNKSNMCRNNIRRLGGGFLGFGYVGCWVVNKSATIEDESGTTNPNKANTFPRRSIRNVLMVLV